MNEASWDVISGEGMRQGSVSMPEWAENLANLQPNQDIFDPILSQQGYTPLRLLGAGHDATVYLAWSEKDGRLVAIAAAKGNSADSSHEGRLMWDAEIRFKFPHKNIVAAIDVVVGQNSAYVISEVIGKVEGLFSEEAHFKRGLTFSQNLANIRDTSDSPEVTINKGLQSLEPIFSALAHLHSNGIVHRDIKPANILCDGNGEPYVLDFGTALKPSEIPNHVKIDPAYSFGYAAPEVLKHEERPHPRQDVYALGCLMYEALTGRAPFFEKMQNPRISQIAKGFLPIIEDPTLPSIINPVVSKELESICVKAMQRDPEKRYQNAGEFLAALSIVISPTQRKVAA